MNWYGYILKVWGENMARINIDGEQNVEVSVKIPCEKSYEEQLEIMEAYT